MNLKMGSIEEFAGYSHFESLAEFNIHMEMWLLELKGEFSKAELVGLKRLTRFSAKIPGVCNAKIGTILKAIHEEHKGNGISRATFKRMIGKAKKLGILTVHETARKNGSQSSNLYIFNRCPLAEPPKREKLNHLNKTINLSKTKNKENKKRSEEPIELDYTYTSNRVPKPFVQLVKCFFNSAKLIEEYWHMTQIAAYRGNREEETEQVLDTSIDAFKQLIRTMKLSKVVRKPIAYYFGILTKKFDELFYQELYELECQYRQGEVSRV
ncbi:MAG: hypothetical protein K0S25_1338 [Bacillus sp. (in: firmicutes)]|jgi:hypothetical protein|nr:hypothetical protein [Neobacillus sp.]MDF2903700.1 hypothetical protein [Bacillus sp. (in: firmicutes)]